MDHHTDQYNQELADQVCDRLSRGESLIDICDEQGMPSYATVRRWCALYSFFGEAFEIARDIATQRLYDEMLAIADDARNDYVEREGKGGSTYIAVDKEAIMRSKLRIDTRKWMLAKIIPNQFGDKSQLDITSSDGSHATPPIPDSVRLERLNALHQAARDRLLTTQHPTDNANDTIDLA